MDSKLPDTISLIGMPGAGKSTVGVILAKLTGPGEVWLQSLPFSRLASRIFAAAPQTGGGGREEGSVLGAVAGGGLLGGLLGGDDD